MIIDTPRMGELGVVNTDLTQSLGDMEELALKYRFRDSIYQGEPTWAIQKALSENSLKPAQLANYQKVEMKLNTKDSAPSKSNKRKLIECRGNQRSSKLYKKIALTSKKVRDRKISHLFISKAFLK